MRRSGLLSHRARELDETLYHDLSRVAQDGNTIIVRDFNCPLDWSLEDVGAEAVRLWEFANDHFLTQVVRTLTRGRNILDLVFATDDDLVREVKVGLGLAGSDHCVVNFQVVTGTESEQTRFGRRLNLRRANYPSFVRALQDTTLEPQESAQELWVDLRAKYEYIQSRVIPFKSQGGSSKVNPSWFNREIKAAIHRRNSLYISVGDEPSPEAQSLLTSQRKTGEKDCAASQGSRGAEGSSSLQGHPERVLRLCEQAQSAQALGAPATRDG